MANKPWNSARCSSINAALLLSFLLASCASPDARKLSSIDKISKGRLTADTRYTLIVRGGTCENCSQQLLNQFKGADSLNNCVVVYEADPNKLDLSFVRDKKGCYGADNEFFDQNGFPQEDLLIVLNNKKIQDQIPLTARNQESVLSRFRKDFK